MKHSESILHSVKDHCESLRRMASLYLPKGIAEIVEKLLTKTENYFKFHVNRKEEK